MQLAYNPVAMRSKHEIVGDLVEFQAIYQFCLRIPENAKQLVDGITSLVIEMNVGH